jgi:transposase-like protein
MTGHGAKFGRKKEEAIAALLTQRNVEEAARAIGVDAKTLLRWMKLPEFQVAYREARRDAFSQSIARLQQATSAAVTTLLKVMVDPGSPASAKVRAADSVLDHAAKAIEIEDLEARIAALEIVQKETKG